MKENISALMDGELDAAEVFDQLRVEGEALETWRTYHLISDAMRDTRLLSAGFTARFAERLAKEPTVLAPVRQPARPVQRFALAAAAGVAGVALVGWMAFAPQPEVATVVAKTPAPVAVPLPASANDYLLAHQGFSPRVSLQGMAPYVRTVAEHAETSGK